MIFGYGIDLAQSLNFTGIVVTKIEKKKMTIATLKKFKNKAYPEIENIIFDLFNKYPPRYIAVDYTNEKSFAQTMENRFNSSFMNSNSSGHKEWKMIRPVVFTQDSKLAMKQNAREMFEKKQFVWPGPQRDPRVWILVEELKAQALREFASPGVNGQLRFPKPEGRDNDLIIALELNLYCGKEFVLNDPEDWGRSRPSRYNPWEKYTCNPCKQGKHQGQSHYIYFDQTGGEIGCPCKICNGL